MTARWRVLVVDDNPEIRATIKAWLDNEPVSVDGSTCIVDEEGSFDAALERLEGTQYDLVILDIRDDTMAQEIAPADLNGDDATSADVGVEIAQQIRARRFAPIIFWTAVPQYAGEANEPFVTVLSKAGDPETLVEAVKTVFQSGLPAVHRALLDHVETVTRDFMANFVEKNWTSMGTAARKGDMAHLLSRRLGASLASGGDVLAANLAEEHAVDVTAQGGVHPMRLYIIPPVDDLIAGELLFGPRLLPTTMAGAGGGTAGDGGGGDGSGGDGDEGGEGEGADEVADGSECWYVVLTPSCDLVAGHVKAEYVVVAGCLPFEGCDEYRRLVAARAAHQGRDPYEPAGEVKKRLTKLFTNNRQGRQQDRDYFLPAAWSVPALLADFQRIAHLPHGDVHSYQRRAQLDGPYAEALVNRATRYLGRVGTPDLDTDELLAKLV